MSIILNGTTGITTPGINNTGAFTFGGAIDLPGGTVGAPSLTTTGDLDTGIYFPAANQIAISTAGTQKLFVGSGMVVNEDGLDFDTRIEGDTDANLFFVDASTDRVGVGTSSPASKLTVSGDIQILSTNYLSFSNTAQQTYVRAAATNTLAFGTDSTERLRIDSAGNLGLGVTPSAWSTGKALQTQAGSLYAFSSSLLDVNQNAYYDGAYKYVNTAAASFYRQNSGTHSWSVAASGTAGNTITFYEAMNVGLSVITLSADEGNVAAASSIRFRTDGTERMRLDLDGNFIVGGTTALGSTANRGNITLNGTSDALYSLGVGGALKGFLYHGGTNMELQNSANGFLAFATNGSERARINSTGAMTIGGTTDDGLLTTIMRASPDINISFRNSSNVRKAIFIADGYYGYQWAQGIYANGGKAFIFANASDVEVGSIVVNSGGTAFNTTSDYRLKDNPQALVGSGDFIDALKPKTWVWKNTGEEGVGFIAHELAEVSPRSVSGEKDAMRLDRVKDESGNYVEKMVPSYQGVEYGSAELIANMVAELQSLRARVASLEGAN